MLDPAPAVEEIRQVAARYRAVLVGPGLARAQNTVRLVEMLVCEDGLPEGLPVVLDAEGLNALAQIDRWPERTRYPLVLTPHSGEMARLCGDEGKAIEAHQIAAPAFDEIRSIR